SPPVRCCRQGLSLDKESIDVSSKLDTACASARVPRPSRGRACVGRIVDGIPVAWEVAAALGAPLDAFVVRKLGAPGHEEFAMGALASGGRVVINDDV